MADEVITTKAGNDDSGKKPAKFGWWEFLNSQFGLWLLGSVLVSLVATMWNFWQSRENSKKADSEFVVTLIPYLTNSSMEVRVRAVQVIQSRYAGEKVPANISTLMCNSLADFGDFRHQVNDILRQHADDFLATHCAGEFSMVEVANGPHASPSPSPAPGVTATPTPLATPANQTQLPEARVYIQIYDEEQRQRAVGIQAALRERGFVVPGIENVAITNPALAKNAVKGTEVRYFNPQDSDAARTIRDFLQQYPDFHDKRVELRSLNLRTNPGTIEIWFAQQDLK